MIRHHLILLCFVAASVTMLTTGFDCQKSNDTPAPQAVAPANPKLKPFDLPNAPWRRFEYPPAAGPKFESLRYFPGPGFNLESADLRPVSSNYIEFVEIENNVIVRDVVVPSIQFDYQANHEYYVLPLDGAQQRIPYDNTITLTLHFDNLAGNYYFETANWYKPTVLASAILITMQTM